MDELKFKVSSGLKNILGRDLITSDNIAILELVKNSYDAHATKVEITFKADSITIADNGKGMSLKDIQQKWLFVGYSAKKDGTEDGQSYRDSFRRNYAGAKGIGRISCDRLARYVNLVTKSNQSSVVEKIQVDWNLFEKSQSEEFDHVPVRHMEVAECISFFPNGGKTGTILELVDLHSSWEKEQILRLRKALEKMINPFSGVDDFCIEIIAPVFEEDDQILLKEIRMLESANDNQSNIAKKQREVVNGIIKNSIADVIKIKTTLIESKIQGGKILTRLSDRGNLIYEIEEVNKFDKLSDVNINLCYLNRAAKYNFSLKMGVNPVKYGNVFLFRNGFRIWPYGEYNDDSWGLNQRAQQGYNRSLGTRDLFGRVDVETNSVNEFKEVSSRDGGLVKTEASLQLLNYFTVIHRRLERYVVGVLWGEGFVRNSYFKSNKAAVNARLSLQGKDKNSDNPANVFTNIGSKVDFLQLIKSLSNDSNIKILQYNSKLADIVSDENASEVICDNVFFEAKALAEKTNNVVLLKQLEEFKQNLIKLQKQKEEALRVAAESKLKAERAEKEVLAERKIRAEKEKELDAQMQKNLYLSATRNTSREVQDITHAISIATTELLSLISNLSSDIQEDDYTKIHLLHKIHEAGFFANKIKQLSMLITKADIVSLKTKVKVNLQEYISEYVDNFKDSLDIVVENDSGKSCWRMLSLLDIAIVLDNLISNSKKAHADSIGVFFTFKASSLCVDFVDDGDGVDMSVFTKETIFEEGVTNRRGGSGIGLYTIKYTMENKLNGRVAFMGNNFHGYKGACFQLTFK